MNKISIYFGDWYLPGFTLLSYFLFPSANSIVAFSYLMYEVYTWFMQILDEKKVSL